MTTAPPATTEPHVTPQAWRVLAVLFVVYAFNFIDRILIVSLFPMLRQEFTLSEFQLQLLGSTSFVIFYTTLGIPFGYLADRVSRTRLIAAGLVLWSIASGMSGFAQDFTQLFLCRMLVGVGEATLGPAAMSILSDYFPARKRGLAQSLYSAAIPIGFALAFLLGSMLAPQWGWRNAFFFVGFPGVLLAPLVLLIKEHPRTAAAPASEGKAASGLRSLLGQRLLWLHVLGFAVFNIAALSVSNVVPSWFTTEGLMTPAALFQTLAVFILIGGFAGSALGGWWVDRLKQTHTDGTFRFGMALAGVTLAIWVLLLTAEAQWLRLTCLFLLVTSAMSWPGVAAAEVHGITGPSLRGMGVSLYLFAANLIGYGIGQPLLGATSDAVRAQGHASPVQLALWLSPVFLVVSGLLFWWASRLRLRQAAGS